MAASRGISFATNLDYSQEAIPSADHAREITRIAIYEDSAYAPRIIEIPFSNDRETIGALSATTHTQITRLGGSYPYRIIQEACENLIHAGFCGVVISIYDKGHTLIISDQGPGIAQPSFALNTGFTSATHEMRKTIRGVGAGFTIIREYLESVGGSLQLDSNIGSGVVLTLRTTRMHTPNNSFTAPTTSQWARHPMSGTDIPSYALTTRQQDVLAVLLKYEFVGPQLVSQTLGTSLSTAHRDLEALETHGLVERNRQNKRTLTSAGFEYVEYLSTH